MTVVLITDDDHIYTANVGDSHAVIIKTDKEPQDESESNPDNIISKYVHKQLTTDHDPEILKENKRICRMGGETRPLIEKKKSKYAI